MGVIGGLEAFPFQVLGSSTWEEFRTLTGRLEHAVVAGEPFVKVATSPCAASTATALA